MCIVHHFDDHCMLYALPKKIFFFHFLLFLHEYNSTRVAIMKKNINEHKHISINIINSIVQLHQSAIHLKISQYSKPKKNIFLLLERLHMQSSGFAHRISQMSICVYVFLLFVNDVPFWSLSLSSFATSKQQKHRTKCT